MKKGVLILPGKPKLNSLDVPGKLCAQSTCAISNSLVKFNIVKLVSYVSDMPGMTSPIAVILPNRFAGDISSPAELKSGITRLLSDCRLTNHLVCTSPLL